MGGTGAMPSGVEVIGGFFLSFFSLRFFSTPCVPFSNHSFHAAAVLQSPVTYTASKVHYVAVGVTY